MPVKKHWCTKHNTDFLNPDNGPKWWHPIYGTEEYCYEQKLEPVAQTTVNVSSAKSIPSGHLQIDELPIEKRLAESGMEPQAIEKALLAQQEPVLTPTPAKRNGHYCKKHMMRFSKMVGWSQYKHPIHGTDLWCYEQEDGNGSLTASRKLEEIEIASIPTANVVEVSTNEHVPTFADIVFPEKTKKSNHKLLIGLLFMLAAVFGIVAAAIVTGMKA